MCVVGPTLPPEVQTERSVSHGTSAFRAEKGHALEREFSREIFTVGERTCSAACSKNLRRYLEVLQTPEKPVRSLASPLQQETGREGTCEQGFCLGGTSGFETYV